MSINLKRALLALVCAVTVIQLGGCVYDRRGHHPEHEGPPRHAEHGPDHAELDIRVHS